MSEIMSALSGFSQFCSVITVIFAFLVAVFKPLRDRLLGTKKIQDGQKCLLRAEMLNIYYEGREQKKIRQYKYENFILCYKAYKALNGNSFIDEIKEKIDTWEIIT